VSRSVELAWPGTARDAKLTRKDALPNVQLSSYVCLRRRLANAFLEKNNTTLASRMTWRETTALGQVRTARRRYVASPEEAMYILLSRISMHSRVEDLEQRFFSSKGPIDEILYEILE
jgi:hypothetical protein